MLYIEEVKPEKMEYRILFFFFANYIFVYFFVFSPEHSTWTYNGLMNEPVCSMITMTTWKRAKVGNPLMRLRWFCFFCVLNARVSTQQRTYNVVAATKGPSDGKNSITRNENWSRNWINLFHFTTYRAKKVFVSETIFYKLVKNYLIFLFPNLGSHLKCKLVSKNQCEVIFFSSIL